jgi:4'-phosphopantetheinyl transferase EntD
MTDRGVPNSARERSRQSACISQMHFGETICRTSSTLAGLLPPGVLCAEIWSGTEQLPIHNDEARCVERAVTARVREFAAGRFGARQLFSHFGILDFPLLIGDDRSPRWPPGLVGSITHTGNYCGVAVGRKSALRGIGIDVEIVGRLGVDLWDQICTEEEIRTLECLVEAQRREVATIIFSAKEAFYKCQYTASQQWLDFRDVNVTVVGNRFLVELRRPMNAYPDGKVQFDGRFVIHSGLVFTGIAWY